MTKELRRVSYQEFAGNLARIFKQVIEQHEAVVVEDENGEAVVVGPLHDETLEATLTDEDYRAFHSAFGSWADVDTDKLKQDIYESRKSSRPSVNL